MVDGAEGRRHALFRRTIRTAAFALATFSACQVARADATSCDGELTEAQQTQRTFCTTFAPCAFVFSIFDTCTQVKTFLSGFAAGGQANGMSLSAVEDAARRMAATEMRDDDEDASIVRCLPGNFDRAVCRRYLGVDPAPVPRAAEPRNRSADFDRRSRMLALFKEEEQFRLRLRGPPAVAVTALATCNEARDRSDRAAICRQAQMQVDACITARQAWQGRKTSLLAEIEKSTPRLGKDYSPGISPLRGLGRQPTESEMWNDTVATLARMEIADCPSTLPGTFLTPNQALESWAAADGGRSAVIAGCDAMSRAAFEAIENADLPGATELTDEFESHCARVEQTYAQRVRLARERIATLRTALLGAPAVPRGATRYGSDLFRGAISQTESEQRDPAEKAARLRAEEAARQRETYAGDSSPDDSTLILNGLVGALQGSAARRAAQSNAQASAAAQQLAQVQSQQQALRQAQQDAYRSQAAQADAFNRQAAEQSRYYAPMTSCASVVATPKSNFSHCIRNTCSKAVEVSFSGGSWTVGAGSCFPVSGAPTLFGVCEKNDFYDKARGQCKR